MKTRAILLSILLVGSMLVGPISLIGGAAAADGAPSGMVGVPDSSISSDLPRQTPMGQQADELKEHGILASKHADTLEVITTNPGRAKEKYSNGNLNGDGPVALVIRDDENHEGREVALSADVLEDILGHRPELARGAHEDGSEWRTEIRYQGDYAILEIPHFSSNTVTFEGTVTITGSPASNGSSWSYDLDSADSVDDFAVELTGHENRVNDTASGSELADGESLSVGVDGTTAPESAEVTLTGIVPDRVGTADWETSQANENHRVDHENGKVAVAYNRTVAIHDASDGSETWSTSSGHSDEILHVLIRDGVVFTSSRDNTVKAFDATDGSELWTSSAFTDEVFGLTYESGSVIGGDYNGNVIALDPADGSQVWSASAGSTIRIYNLASHNGKVYSVSNAQEVMEFDAADGSEGWTSNAPSSAVRGVGANEHGVFSASDTGIVRSHSLADGSVQWSIDIGSNSWAVAALDDNVYVGADDDKLRSIDVADGRVIWTSNVHQASVWSVSPSADYIYTGSNDDTARRLYNANETEAPSVSVDGNTVSHSGTLEVGQTVTESVSLSLGDHSASVSTADSSEVQVDVEIEEITETVDPELTVNGNTTSYTGTLANGSSTSLDVDPAWIREGTNNVSVAASTATDGPPGQVDLDYSHTAIDNQTVAYGDEVFSERYSVSKTFASDRENAVLRIPFRSTVVHVRTLEQQRDDQIWSDIAADNYTLDGTTLEVQLGDVDADTTVEVRAVGSKVRPRDGSIAVKEVTTTGTDLNSKIEIESMGSDFRLEVNESAYGSNLHYTHTESWSDVAAYARVEDDGTQALYMPNAANGSTTKISTIPLEVDATMGNADIRVLDAGPEPEFEFRDSTTADSASLIWKDTNDGYMYQLYNVGINEEIERKEASSPVTFDVSSPSGLTVAIYDLGPGGGGSADDGIQGPIPDSASVLESLRLPLTVLIGAIAVVFLFLTWRRGPTAAAKTIGSGGTRVGRTVTGTLSRTALWLRSHPLVAAVVLGGLGLFAVSAGVLSVPAGAGTVVLVASVPIVAYLVLVRQLDASWLTWVAVTGIATILGLQLLGNDVLGTLIESEAFPLVVIGVMYLAYRALQAYQAEQESPEEVNKLVFNTDGGSDQEDDDEDGGNA